MTGNAVRWLVRLGLFGVLGGLLVCAWLTDRPSPAYPHGQFGELILSALVLCSLAAATAAFLWRARRK